MRREIRWRYEEERRGGRWFKREDEESGIDFTCRWRDPREIVLFGTKEMAGDQKTKRREKMAGDQRPEGRRERRKEKFAPKARRNTEAIVDKVLKRNNYDDWKYQIERYLQEHGLWDIVNGTESQPADSRDKTWKQKNEEALKAIRDSCGPQKLSSIKKEKLAKDAWDHLASLSHHKGTTDVDYMRYLSLCNAVAKGDWEKTQSFPGFQDAVNARVSIMNRTMLHIATSNGHVHIVEKLVELMSEEALEVKDIYGSTALSLAAANGSTKINIAKPMVRKYKKLLCIKNSFEYIPVVMAAANGNKEMVYYLYSKTPDEELNPDTGNNSGALLLTSLITADMFDVALDLVERYPNLCDLHEVSALLALAKKPSAFQSGCIKVRSTHSIEGNIENPKDEVPDIENPCEGSRRRGHAIFKVSDFVCTAVPGINNIYQLKLKHNQALELLKSICRSLPVSNDSEVIDNLNQKQNDPTVIDMGINAIVEATKHGIVELIVHIIRSYPFMIDALSEKKQNIFLSAISYRQEGIFNLLKGMHARKNESDITDEPRDNMLHLAGMLAPSSRLSNISGAAMQMQRELQWFKEVEKLVLYPMDKEQKNQAGKTPRELLTEEHKELVKAAEKWMKGTASSCMVVATLIATVMFAAAFTVPGGNHGETGIAIFLDDNSFLVFIIADALSLFSSSTSVLMFLGILTSRYTEDDFLTTLPRRMIIGLATLFFSLTTMTIAFAATLFIILHERITWVAIPVSLLASIPISLFALLQFPLLFEMITSTYGSGIFNEKTEPLY
ncbi:hypothetical protein HHK36_031706 [Tetracentron sinense]|uniref:PGG domain-containing protein n=1 Tax=Tetracentron sinense TaxID=13715 RepID=A0A834Y8P9_TETSI|nr:hypothetical protein HHK36_031706 [Tetracentron sinense]